MRMGLQVSADRGRYATKVEKLQADARWADQAGLDSVWTPQIPDEFDVTRADNRHLGFGGGGPHYCLGASLARTQLRSIFGELLRVLPDIEAEEPELLRSAFIHGVKRMDCTFRPRA